MERQNARICRGMEKGNMNVNDLINELQKIAEKFNCGDAMVVIDGYEGGLEKLEIVRLIEAAKDADYTSGQTMFGEYYDTVTHSKRGKQAVYFPRRANA